jgi:hypothetical protein
MHILHKYKRIENSKGNLFAKINSHSWNDFYFNLVDREYVHARFLRRVLPVWLYQTPQVFSAYLGFLLWYHCVIKGFLLLDL